MKLKRIKQNKEGRENTAAGTTLLPDVISGKEHIAPQRSFAFMARNNGFCLSGRSVGLTLFAKFAKRFCQEDDTKRRYKNKRRDENAVDLSKCTFK